MTTTPPNEEALEREKAAYLDPETTVLDDEGRRIVSLVDEIRHLRAAGQHWKSRALEAEPALKQAEAARDELQRKLNEKLAAESAAAVSSKNGRAEPTAAVEGIKP